MTDRAQLMQDNVQPFQPVKYQTCISALEKQDILYFFFYFQVLFKGLDGEGLWRRTWGAEL